MNIKDLKLGGVYKDKNGNDHGARKVRKSLFIGKPDEPIDTLEFSYTGNERRGLRFVTNALEVIYLSRADIKGFMLLRTE
jgi:hypothetical protein